MLNLPKSQQNETSLVVLLHAYTRHPRDMRHVRDAIQASKPQAHIVVPKLPLGLFSTADANEIALQLRDEIAAQVQFRAQQNWPKFTEIIFVGHSLGALIARKVYLLACGISEAPLDGKNSRPSENIRLSWAADVTRLILLAGLNRGWSVTYHVGILRSLKLSAGTAFGHFLLTVFNKRLVVFQARRGSAFLTQLRLQWLVLAADCRAKGFRIATTLQLLGSIDDLVSPDDNIDLETGRDFIYFDVPLSGHANVIQMDNSSTGLQRRQVFTNALMGEEASLRARQILPADPTLAQIRPDVTNVIFVIHGIRDEGYWTQKIARKVIGLGQAPPRIYASETATYGYFSMLAFLLPSQRRRKVEWLMDQYVEAKSLYPNATFSYIGHSHGTYLLATAVSEYRACRFDHAVLAGSVVRRKFDWLSVIKRNQIKKLLNYVATADWVVAFFPGALEKLHLQDVGSAGHNGFAQAAETPGGPIYERRYIQGGHSAALVEQNWDDLAYFTVNGQPAPAEPKLEAPRRSWFVVAVGWVSPIVWIVAVLLIYVLGRGIWSIPSHEWSKTLAVVIYAIAIWRILTRL